MENRTVSFDLIRITTCFFIILMHAADYFAIALPYASSMLKIISRIGVPLFFMISGALLLPVRKPMKEFLVSRLKRILIPLLFWSLLYAFVRIDFNSGQIVGQMLQNLKSPHHLWYLYAITGIYLFLPYISPWLKVSDKGEQWLFITLWAVTLTANIVLPILPNIIGYYSYITNFAGYFGFMLLGYVLHQYSTNRNTGLKIVAVALIAAGVLSLMFRFYILDLDVSNYLSIDVALLSAGVFLLSVKFNSSNAKTCNILAHVSSTVFGIYLIHMLILKFVVEKYIISGESALLIILSATLTYLISYMVIRLLSKIPYSKYIIG